MSKEGKFLIYCMEVYKSSKDLSGEQVAELFDKYRIMEYIMTCYEALHTTGENYIIDDIEQYIEENK